MILIFQLSGKFSESSSDFIFFSQFPYQYYNRIEYLWRGAARILQDLKERD